MNAVVPPSNRRVSLGMTPAKAFPQMARSSKVPVPVPVGMISEKAQSLAHPHQGRAGNNAETIGGLAGEAENIRS
jgi:hypothetical protein